MRERLLNFIVCPVCKKKLQLSVFTRSTNCVDEGILRCACGQKFPIIRGVPRLLIPELQLDLPLTYPDFYNRYKNLINCEQVSFSVQINQETRATVSRFGYEWSEFSEYNCDNFTEFIAPLPSGFFEGKLGLDAGCGAGRHAGRASALGAEMIAIDISQAVDSAYQNNLNNDSVHIIQTDIYHLPFRTELFDFIYSLG
jgi:uncharacterized protein YbaR (Trm112 family)